MSSAIDRRDARPRQRCSKLLGDDAELGVLSAHDQQRRRAALSEPIVQRCHLAGASGSQAAGETLGVGRQTLDSRCMEMGLPQRGLSREQRVGHPLVHEGFEVGFHALGSGLVSLDAPAALGPIRDAGGGTDQGERPEATRPCAPQRECHSAAHGIADEVEGLAVESVGEGGDLVGHGLHPVELEVVGSVGVSVPHEVGGDHPQRRTVRPGRGETLGERGHGCPRSGEPVQHEDRHAANRAGRLHGQLHAPGPGWQFRRVFLLY